MGNLLLNTLKIMVRGTDYCASSGENPWKPGWGALSDEELKYDILVYQFKSNRFFTQEEVTATASFYCRKDVVSNWGCSLNRKTVLYGFNNKAFFLNGGWNQEWNSYASNTELIHAVSQQCQCNTMGCSRPVCWPPPRVLKESILRVKPEMMPPLNANVDSRMLDFVFSTYVIPGIAGVCSNAFNFNAVCTQPYPQSQIRIVFDSFYDEKGVFVKNNEIIKSSDFGSSTSNIRIPVVIVENKEKKPVKINRFNTDTTS